MIRNGDYLNSFRPAYTNAVKENKEEFTYKGQPMLTKFAKYVCEFSDLELLKLGEHSLAFQSNV